MQPGSWLRRNRRQLLQRIHHRLVTALDEQPLRRVAPPAVRVRQRFNQRGSRGGRQRWPLVASRGLVDDAVNAAEPSWLFELSREDLIAQILGDVATVLDDPAMHVDDVKRAVWRRGE